MTTPYRIALCVLTGLATRHFEPALSFTKPMNWRLRLLTFLLAEINATPDGLREPTFPVLVDRLLTALGLDLGNAVAQARACMCMPGLKQGWSGVILKTKP
jgi:hypothetical protein